MEVKATMPRGMYQGDVTDFSTITKSMYGLSASAITASSEPIGMQINMEQSARNHMGLMYGHMRE